MQEPTSPDPEVHEPVLDHTPDPAPAAASASEGPPPLRRDMSRRMLGGVCAGIARAYDYDVTVVRVVALLLTLPGGFGLVLYAALWVLMPADDGTPQPASTAPTSNAEDLAERIRLAADELVAATRAAAEAARVAAEQLSEVARAASAAGRESWESRPSAQTTTTPAPPSAVPSETSPAPTSADTTAAVASIPPADPAVPEPPESLDRPATNPPANPPAV